MPDQTAPVTVTRIEIADLLAPVFAAGGGETHELHAAATDARPAVRELLERLPERRYTSLRQLWEDR